MASYRGNLVLPPKEIPDNLTHQEYLKLFLRYQILGWQRQIARSSRMVMKTQPPSSNLSEDAKTKMTVLMTGLEGVIIVRDIQQGITEHAGAIVGVTASQAGQLMDKNETLKKARNGLASAFSLLSSSVQSTIDKSIASHVLPAFGLPVDGIPDGKTAEEYMHMAEQYERIGLPEPTRDALDLALAAADTDDLRQRARNMFVTRVPKVRVDDKVHEKMIAGARHNLTLNLSLARDIYLELTGEVPKFEWPYVYLASIELQRGDELRCKDLLDKAHSLNSNSLKVLAGQARMYMAEWKINELRKVTTRMEALEPGNNIAKSFRDVINLADQSGI